MAATLLPLQLPPLSTSRINTPTCCRGSDSWSAPGASMTAPRDPALAHLHMRAPRLSQGPLSAAGPPPHAHAPTLGPHRAPHPAPHPAQHPCPPLHASATQSRTTHPTLVTTCCRSACHRHHPTILLACRRRPLFKAFSNPATHPPLASSPLAASRRTCTTRPCQRLWPPTQACSHQAPCATMRTYSGTPAVLPLSPTTTVAAAPGATTLTCTVTLGTVVIPTVLIPSAAATPTATVMQTAMTLTGATAATLPVRGATATQPALRTTTAAPASAGTKPLTVTTRAATALPRPAALHLIGATTAPATSLGPTVAPRSTARILPL